MRDTDTNISAAVVRAAKDDPAAGAALEALGRHGNVYAVGGIVRDTVLGVTGKDVDLLVQGVSPDDVQAALERLPGRVDYTGKHFGVFRYRASGGGDVEVALPRTERSVGAGHRDFEVVSDHTLAVEEDLARRDFTGNAIAVNLATGEIIDPYRGREDLRGGLLRTVSEDSFRDDPLRILRALSSVSRHGLAATFETAQAMAQHAAGLHELPAERVAAELDKTLAGSDPVAALNLAEMTGVLREVLPDVAAMEGFDQRSKYHSLLLHDHTKAVVGWVVEQGGDVDLRWAALLHDVGKPTSQWIDEHGYGHYYQADGGVGADHEIVGADMARRILNDLKFPTERITRIVRLVRHHMFPPFKTETAARRFVNRVGPDYTDDLLTLRWADVDGKEKDFDSNVPQMRALLEKIRAEKQPTGIAMLAIDGHDLLAAGHEQGPSMGATLRMLLDAVIEDATLNTRDNLFDLLRNSGVGKETKA
jgi:putative nucleotidyltransferase with HDIG domain